MAIVRLGGRRLLTWIAIYAVALHAILVGLATPALAGQPAAFDPLSAICHSTADGQDDQTTGRPAPGHACEHCNLCSIAGPPAAPDAALAGILKPARIAHVLRPASGAPIAGLVQSPKLARGPPSAA
jgi:hypothetical protein